jgi:beta-hydroxylase
VAEVVRPKEMAEDLIHFKDTWVRAWTGSPNWLNFGLIYANQILHPELNSSRILSTLEALVQRPFYMVGYSLLKPGYYIPQHKDEDVFHKFDNVWHFGLDVPPECYLKVNDAEFQEQEGSLLTFDDGHSHSAWNLGTRERIVMYIKFVTEALQCTQPHNET